MGLFNDRKKTHSQTHVPVWFMRQAGRYHAHYQNIKKDSDFMSMCKTPKLACEITMGPIEDFDFDAAILFSDLLFPLEQLGLGLKYAPGPILDRHVKDLQMARNLKVSSQATEFFDFQKQALILLREKLPQEKTLLGFVGAPFTLYTYAVEGSHAGGLIEAKKGLFDGRFDQFFKTLKPQLIENMIVQAKGGANAICLFDTAAGELALNEYEEFMVPAIREITQGFKQACPDTPIIYYSKFTHRSYLRALNDDNIDVLGIDWRMDLRSCIEEFGERYYIQGNFDPSLLHLPWPDLEKRLELFWNQVSDLGPKLDKWIMGLGHGVLQHTPEENVKKTVQYVHSNFIY
jgi:uroporphyrinogen decarboxylase